MKKFQEWLVGLSVAIAIWALLVKESSWPNSKLHPWSFEILISPVIAIFTFAVYAASVMLYRVYTFNDCKEAAEELNKEIEMAKEDLKKKGYKF